MAKVKMPSKKQVDAAHAAIAAENAIVWQREHTSAEVKNMDEIARRVQLPSEHPDHYHSMMCDGQDGMNSYCERFRRKLFDDKE